MKHKFSVNQKVRYLGLGHWQGEMYYMNSERVVESGAILTIIHIGEEGYGFKGVSNRTSNVESESWNSQFVEGRFELLCNSFEF